MDAIQNTLHLSFVGRDDGDIVNVRKYGAVRKLTGKGTVECFVDQNEQGG